ncbi:hypothetical protein mRhiFer1_009700 [Rhinolophus ferrumequinum]|uniref:Uncharacterized protein n=1 Tax=Rhinolophus ferrumequinum TaxID=59479 RepID=A0A7J7R187_RHIFE|nr:hypothetical protein mRhiFer1_009700 [Rhinolophus ferrumequinum]
MVWESPMAGPGARVPGLGCWRRAPGHLCCSALSPGQPGAALGAAPHGRQGDLSSASHLLLIGGESGKPAVIGPQGPTSTGPSQEWQPAARRQDRQASEGRLALSLGCGLRGALLLPAKSPGSWLLTSHLSTPLPLLCHSGLPARWTAPLAPRQEHRLIRAQPQAEPAWPASWQQGPSGSVVAGGPWAAAPPHTLNLTSSLPLALPQVGHPSNH